MPTSSTFSKRRVIGCAGVLGYLLFLAAVILGAAATLSACTTVPQTRWTALSVAGTGHDQVFQDGRPRIAGLYRIVATEPGKADFFRGDRYVGSGTVQIIEPNEGNVKLEVAPGARVVISPSR